MVVHRFVLVILLVLGPAIGSARVDAASIYVDFGDYQGSATDLVDNTMVTWNVVPTVNPLFAALGLKDADGVDTGIQISAMTGFDTGYDDTLPGGAWNVAGIPWSVGEATNDNFACSGSGNIVFSNLSAPYYQIELISSRADSASTRVADYLANGAYADSGGPTGSQSFSASIDGWGNKSVMFWELVQPDQDHKITLHLSPNSGNWSYVNAMRLQAVPEPSAGMLFIGMAMAVTSWRRRVVRHDSHG